ncbi:MAG: anti-sigma factor [Alphaproteobacteria bacterium]|nr:anti-sigma factor [Alphaproteobacteria bacterium]
MLKRSDDRLIAYLDGEVDASERRDIEAWLDADPAARDKLAAFAESAALVRSAFDEVMHEPVPERLIAVARGESPSAKPSAQVLPFKRAGSAAPASAGRSWWFGVPLAASLCGMLLGGSVAYLSVAKLLPATLGGKQPGVEMAAADNLWLDNAAGYFKLAASAGDGALIDVPATSDPREALQKISQSLPQEVRLPDLKPWGLTFRGARLVVAEGRPAAQLVYTTENKAIGPLTLIIGSSKQSDIPPTLARRQDVNLLYWRHQGRAYALVGQTDIGYLWGIANDVAWQLDAI